MKRRDVAPVGSLRAVFDEIPDARRGQGRVQTLGAMLALSVCAMLCGARSLYAIAQWGQECGPDIRAALGLRRDRGPSVATLHRAFRRIEHTTFERVLSTWFATQGLHAEEGIALDGKTLRGIHGDELPGVHLVAAYAHQTCVVLGQFATQGKGHEVAGAKQVLAALPATLLVGHVVTGDALLATHALCEQIVAQKGGISSPSRATVPQPGRR